MNAASPNLAPPCTHTATESRRIAREEAILAEDIRRLFGDPS